LHAIEAGGLRETIIVNGCEVMLEAAPEVEIDDDVVIMVTDKSIAVTVDNEVVIDVGCDD